MATLEDLSEWLRLVLDDDETPLEGKYTAQVLVNKIRAKFN